MMAVKDIIRKSRNVSRTSGSRVSSGANDPVSQMAWNAPSITLSVFASSNACPDAPRGPTSCKRGYSASATVKAGSISGAHSPNGLRRARRQSASHERSVIGFIGIVSFGKLNAVVTRILPRNAAMRQVVNPIPAEVTA